jgi:hypothetical protein
LRGVNPPSRTRPRPPRIKPWQIDLLGVALFFIGIAVLVSAAFLLDPWAGVGVLAAGLTFAGWRISTRTQPDPDSPARRY